MIPIKIEFDLTMGNQKKLHFGSMLFEKRKFDMLESEGVYPNIRTTDNTTTAAITINVIINSA